jgi:hypothetical protein
MSIWELAKTKIAERMGVAMDESSQENEDIRKKAIFDCMSSRRQKFILKQGYENWDPFQEPKDPIDIRKDKTKRTTQTLVREFLQSCSFDQISNDFSQGALEVCLGLMNDDEKSRGMFEFSCWYKTLLASEGVEKTPS